MFTDSDEISNLYRGPPHRSFLPNFGSFGYGIQFQRKRFFRNKNCLWRQCLLMDRDEMSNLDREYSIDASYHAVVHLAKRFQRRRFLDTNQSETRIAFGPCLLTDWSKMSNLCREPSKDASYTILVHLSKRLFFRNHPIRNKNCL